MYLVYRIGLGPVEKGQDLFLLELDSLQVFNLVRAINAAHYDHTIEAKQVFEESSIAQLAEIPRTILKDLYAGEEHAKYSKGFFRKVRLSPDCTCNSFTF